MKNNTHNHGKGKGGTGHHHDHEEEKNPEHKGHQEHQHGDHQNHKDHDHQAHHKMMVKDFRTRFWISLAATVPVLALSPMIQGFLGLADILSFPYSKYVTFAISTFIFFYGGWPFLKGLVDEMRKRQPGMMTLIGLAITVAYVYSGLVVFFLPGRFFFWELATLIDVMLLGHWIEMRSVMGASRALEELARLMPSQAHKVTEEGTRDVPIEELEPGDKVLIKPGEKIPADGDVVEGSSSVNEAMLTGESKPVAKSENDEVIGGSVNGEGSLTVEVTKTGKDSYLSRVVQMVRSAQASKSKTQDLANTAAMWLTIVAISAGALTLAGWLVFTGKEFSFSLERTVTVMVITCPHALGLAIPLVVAVSTALSAKNGLLIRNRQAFERARKIDAVIFDKTGTLTKGEFGVSDVISFGGMSEEEILSYAASVETHSEHPIGRRIAEAADEVWDAADFTSTTGKGVQARVKGREVMVVSAGYLEEKGIEVSNKDLDKILEQGKTTAFVLIDDEPVGVIGLADEIRPESAEAIKNLKEMGVRPMMLTGDNRNVAKWVAGELGLDEYFAQVLPDEKSAKVKEVQERGLTVAMTGDGVNDAPALAQADVGIAIGAGTDVAAETADIILVKSNPKDVLAVLKLSGATWKKMVQNLIWATGYNVVAIPLAAGVLFSLGIILSPAVGALLMSLSTVIVAVNAVLLKVRK